MRNFQSLDSQQCHIQLVAPSSPVPLDRMNRGLDVLRSWGLTVDVPSQVTLVDGYLAGSDAARFGALNSALVNPANDVVWAARGGYGMGRLLAMGLNLQAPDNPPWVVGFSDISLLLLHLAPRGWPCVHGPNITTLPDLQQEDLLRLSDVLFRGQGVGFSGLNCLAPGQARGPIAPINWTVLCSVVGTPMMPSLEGHILLLEDVNESSYRLDRNLLQISNTPWFPKLAGLVLGDLGGAEQDPRLLRSIADVTARLGIPCATGAPVGHGRRLASIRVGQIVEFDADQGTVA